MTDAEKVTKLASAISRADRELDVLLAYHEIGSIASPAGRKRCSEWAIATALRVRKILRNALKKAEAGHVDS